MKRFTAILASLVMLAALATPAFAGGDNGDCNGSPSCEATGNFQIGVFAAGGGIDGDLFTSGYGDAAGGIGAAGGVALGGARGGFETIQIPIYETVYLGNLYGWGRWNPDNYASVLIGYESIPLGGAGANIGVIAGGFTNTEAGFFDPGFGDLRYGVYSVTDGYATVGGYVNGFAFGLASSEALVGGVAGQFSLDGSIVTDQSPMISEGFSLGIAGQGSLAYFVAGGAAFGLGEYDAGGQIEMFGGSVSESYRAIEFDGPAQTDYMGTNVAAFTTIYSYGYNNSAGLAGSFVEGGFVAGGIAKSLTKQVTDTGVAKAYALGTYTGAGELGCNLNLKAVGGTHTSATKVQGYTGSVMTSSASMKVTSTPAGPQ